MIMIANITNNLFITGGGETDLGPGPPDDLQTRLQTMTVTEKKPARRVGAKPPPDRAQKSMGCLSLKNPLRLEFYLD